MSEDITLRHGDIIAGSQANKQGHNTVPIAAAYDGTTYTPKVRLAGPMSAFGDILVAERTPQVQMKFPYGVNSDIGQTLTNKAGSSVTSSDGNAIVTCSSTAESFSQIRTIDTVRYGPGQGCKFMGTCAFTTGVANSSQVFGPGDDDEGYYFGYNGTSFGVMRRSGGTLEVRSLEITAGAGTSAGNITITLDDTAVTVAVALNDTVAEVVAKIVAASADIFNAGRGWEVRTPDSVTVEFISLVAENATGTFSFADTDTTGVTANAFSTDVTGVAPTETWVAQSSWNIDKMDGTGPSGMTLDPTKGNVYGIEWQYLGYGAITFAIEDDNTGMFQPVHRIDYTNQNTTPTVVNPTFHLNLIAKTESGYSGGALTMKTASMAGFIEGKESIKGIRRGVTDTKTVATTELPVMILHNKLVYNSAINKVSVYPDYINFSTDATKSAIIRVYLNPTEITGGVAMTAIDSNSVMEHSGTGTGIVGGTLEFAFVIGAGEGKDLQLSNEELTLRPEDRLVITAEHVSGSGGDVTVGASWLERI